MKKITYLLLSAMVMVSAIGMCACGSGKEDETTTTPTSTKEDVSTPVEDNNEDESTSAEDDNKVAYTVKVVDEAGNPIANAMVQLCMDLCVPAMTNADGVAEWSLEEADYKVSFLKVPDGYTYSDEVEEFYYEDGKTDMTITLKAVAE